MLLIPAIDIKDGACVRLRQGRMDESTVFSDDPVATAKRWADLGAQRLHIVDLDGAIAGEPVNRDIIHAMIAAVPDLAVQVGGGIRSEDAIEDYVGAGVRYVILSSKAATAPHFIADVCVEFPGHIILGIDAKNGKVATQGWSKMSNHDVVDLAKRFEKDGVEAIIFTDISRDGMLNGVNIEATLDLARQVRIPVIASGGIRNIEDVRALAEVADEGIIGAITGRAIYEGSLDFVAGQKLADEINPGYLGTEIS